MEVALARRQALDEEASREAEALHNAHSVCAASTPIMSQALAGCARLGYH